MSDLPALLQQLADRQWERLLPQLTPEQAAVVLPFEFEVRHVFGLSDFIAESAIRYPDMLVSLLSGGERHLNDRCAAYASELTALLAGIDNEDHFKQVLRRFRRRQMMVIAWREMLGWAMVDESFCHLTELANQLIAQALDWLYRKACQEQGTPQDADGHSQPLVVLGMGKLGGGELNFSSDIDLIFCYPENGETQGGRRRLDNQTFFIRLGQQLINALHQNTADGQVFRVDMRLRPFGEAGPLAVSFAAMEDYYQHHGRSWERYAMVKARVIGPASPAAAELQQMLKPFVYRRYIDFGAIDALRKMKAMIEAEVRRKGLKGNIKLGAGGIREIEFIAQVYQLIRGGREPSLQVRHLPEVLTALAQTGDVSAASCQQLIADYRYLRRVENLLQEMGDQQTQTLPDNERDRLRLVAALGAPNWMAFQTELTAVMARVHAEFVAVIGESEAEAGGQAPLWNDLWVTNLSDEETLALLTPVCSEPEALTQALQTFKAESLRRPIGPQGRDALNRLMPRLLQAICERSEPATLFIRIQELLSQIITRSAYLQLLVENPGVLQQLLRLCAASDVISRQLSRYPILLDELLDPQHLYHPTPLDQYREELRQHLMRVPEDDVEQQMESLRQFKQIQLLRITAADIVGALPLMQVSDHLTWLAEAILDEVVNEAWYHLTSRYGMPEACRREGRRDFCVVAYGKLGGIELGYGSDLDLVFLHGGNPDALTDGPRQIDARQFYVRLAQRILHLFSTRTPSGILYEVDMRLRPSGEAGLLVSSLFAYEHYLQNEAWTWELQALVRARAVVGEPEMVAEFQRIRTQVLSQPRDLAQLRQAVCEMRDKMRTHLLRGTVDEFDLKQGAGGMVDIEFIAQFMVLAHAATSPRILTRWSDNVRIFESCVATDFLSPEEAEQMQKAYLAIRDIAHRCTLSGRSRIVAASELTAARAAVTALWQRLLG